jgi:hypothetical protein
MDSGLSAAEGEGCGASAGACVSTVIRSVSTGFTIDLVMSRRAIQIRWASSDLSILQTHPLTPGLTLVPGLTQASNFPVVTHPTLPTIGSRHHLALGLAFIPLLLAIFGVATASLILWSKQQHSTGAIGGTFRPAILSKRVMVVLIGLMVSAIVLLEISGHVLPQKRELLKAPKSSSLEMTEVHISEITTKRQASNSSSPYEVSCEIEGNYTISLATTEYVNPPPCITQLGLSN